MKFFLLFLVLPAIAYKITIINNTCAPLGSPETSIEELVLIQPNGVRVHHRVFLNCEKSFTLESDQPIATLQWTEYGHEFVFSSAKKSVEQHTLKNQWSVNLPESIFKGEKNAPLTLSISQQGVVYVSSPTGVLVLKN